MIDLNGMAVQSAEIAERRGQGTDVMKTLKHCAGEVIEAAEAYAKASLDSFASELADVVMCVLTICGSNGVQIETVLEDCIKKNQARIKPSEPEPTAPKQGGRLYTTQEAAELIGIKRTTFNQYIYMRKHADNLFPVEDVPDGHDKRVKLYTAETVAKIAEHFKTEKPDGLTKRELARKCGVTRPTIKNIADRLGIKSERVILDGKRTAVFAREDAEKIAAEIKAGTKQPEAVKPEQKPTKRFERDPRCDDINWWPDPTPQCFKGEE